MASAVLGPGEAICEILTFKEGFLSPIAHDLLLRVATLEIALDREPLLVSARFDARSLRVISAMRDGRAAPEALSPREREEIEATVRSAVLHADRYPEIRFVSRSTTPTEDGWEVRGTLTLLAAAREIAAHVRRRSERLVTEVRLHQPDFGIRPYRAMLGALRVQPDVVVRVSVPATIAAA